VKFFAIAFAIVCGVAAILFAAVSAILTFLGQPQAVNAAGTLAVAVILTFPKVAEFLELVDGKRKLAGKNQSHVYDFHSFQIAWPLMVLYGTILLCVIREGFGYVAGFVLGAAGGKLEGLPHMMAVTTVPAAMFGMYFIARWIGTRCTRRGIIATLLVAILAITISALLEIVGLTDEDYRLLLGHEKTDYAKLFGIKGLGVSILAAVGLLGYWRGHKQRLSKYLYYLLGVLPVATRETVVDLAFEEAQKVALSVDRK
jgi:hypothetical protein